MPVLIDTNILLRTLQPANSHCAMAQRAIDILRSRRETLWVCAQNIVEFWAVVTRPLQENGLGFSIGRALQEVAAIKRHFPVLPETPLLPAWESLVSSHHAIGRSVHDARLVAAMIQHRLDSILTFNTQDFMRHPQIKILDPQTF
jgi:predicted nucleic acid-binding protein